MKPKKKARKVIGKLRRDAIRWRLAEHLYERGWVTTPSLAVLAAGMILDDIRPMIEAELIQARATIGASPETPDAPTTKEK